MVVEQQKLREKPSWLKFALSLGSASVRDEVENELVTRMKQKGTIRRIVTTTPDAEIVLTLDRKPVSYQIIHKRISKGPTKIDVAPWSIDKDMDRLHKIVTSKEEGYEFSPEVVYDLKLAITLHNFELYEEGEVLGAITTLAMTRMQDHIRHHEEHENGTAEEEDDYYDDGCYHVCNCGHSSNELKKMMKEDHEYVVSIPIGVERIFALILQGRCEFTYIEVTQDHDRRRERTSWYFTSETLCATLGRLVDRRLVSETPFRSPFILKHSYKVMGDEVVVNHGDSGGYYCLSPEGAKKIVRNMDALIAKITDRRRKK